MATCSISAYTGAGSHRRSRLLPPARLFSSTKFYCPSSSINLCNSFTYQRNSWSGLCCATSPQEDPSSQKRGPPASGLTATVARFQDKMKISFAVLFWMSLFFWSSTWDGWNGRKRGKGSRFRK